MAIQPRIVSKCDAGPDGRRSTCPTASRAGGVIVAVIALCIPASAWAHATEGAPVGWWSWDPAPAVALPLALAGAWYARGAWRRRHRLAPGEALLVAAGLVTLAIALLSPVDPLGERSYTAHQIQHLLLRSVAPLLLFVAAPVATFVTGVPRGLRRFAGAAGRFAPARSAFRVLLHPIVVTAVFVATAWIWQWPPYFTAALRDGGTHDWMHFTMLGSGVLFWWRVFDDRPSAPGYGQRVVMLWAAPVANIVLGAILTLKEGVTYPIYEELGRYWFDGTTDEILGGLVVWIPGSQMALIGLLVVIKRWGQRESRRATLRLRPGGAHPTGTSDRSSEAPSTAGVGIRRQALALGALSATIVLVFVTWIGWAVVTSS